jgi:hypothetical protein
MSSKNKVLGFSEFASLEKNFYGNPTLSQKKIMNAEDPLWDLYEKSGLWKKHIAMGYPGQEESKKEIEILIEAQKRAKDPNAPGYIPVQFIKDVEKNHYGVWHRWLTSQGATTSLKGVKAYMDSTDKILFKLKYHFQRTRPSQFAFLNKMPFYPILNSDADSPAYPSGHALDAYKIGYAIGEKFPDLKVSANEFSKKTADTRIVGGVHYPSDHEFSKKIFEDLVETGIISRAIEIYPF